MELQPSGVKGDSRDTCAGPSEGWRLQFEINKLSSRPSVITYKESPSKSHYKVLQIEHAELIQTGLSFHRGGSSSGQDGHEGDHLGGGKQVRTHGSLFCP